MKKFEISFVPFFTNNLFDEAKTDALYSELKSSMRKQLQVNFDTVSIPITKYLMEHTEVSSIEMRKLLTILWKREERAERTPDAETHPLEFASAQEHFENTVKSYLRANENHFYLAKGRGASVLFIRSVPGDTRVRTSDNDWNALLSKRETAKAKEVIEPASNSAAFAIDPTSGDLAKILDAAAE